MKVSMRKILAVFMGIVAAGTMNANASNDHITNVQFDGKDCSETKGVYKTDQVEFRVNIEDRSDERAKLGFFPLPGSEPKARVELVAPLIVDPLTFTPQGDDQSYKPNMTIAAYISRLNDLKIPGFRRFIWNQNGQQTLLKGRSGPVVIFELRKTLKFYDSAVKHDPKTHQSEVFVQYGLEEDKVRSEFPVYRFMHEHVPTPVADYLWLDPQKNIRRLVSVVRCTLPESVRNTWAEAAAFNPLPPYAELEHELADEKLLNSDAVHVPEGGLYFKKDHGTPLESKYVYVRGQGQYFMTRLRRVEAQLFQAENRGAEGYVFTALEGQGPELHILGHTPYPLLLDPVANLTPQFKQNGYYRPDSMSWDQQTVNQTFVEYPDSQNVVVYKSRDSSAFSEANLTGVILDQATDVADLTECLQHFNIAYRGKLTPKVIVRLAGVPAGIGRFEATDRLVPLIEACMGSTESIEHTEFGQLVLTDPTLQKFLRPHIESFPKMHMDVDTLHFGKEVITNPFIEWLWRSRFQFQTLKNVNAQRVEISCVGHNNEPLTKLSELRGMKPSTFKIFFENLGAEDVENLKAVVRENPYLTEFHLAGPVGQVDAAFFMIIADHHALQNFTFKPDGGWEMYRGLTDAQIQRFFLKARYNTQVTVDLGTDVLSRMNSSTLVTYLTNNAAYVEKLITGPHKSDVNGDVVAKLSNLKSIDTRKSTEYHEFSLGNIVQALSKLDSVTEVAVYFPSWNSMGYSGYTPVRDGLAAIPNLRSLTLKCCDWDSWHKTEIEKKRAENKALSPATIFTE
jgi:hypothetical protein